MNVAARIRGAMRRQSRVRLRALLCAAGLLAVTGCAQMSASECQLADWQTVGFEDGASGAPPARIGTYRKACAAHGVAPDLAAYRAGREAGLAAYCRPQNGFRLGERGTAYAGLCPASLEPDFLHAYRAGTRIHGARQSVRAAASRVERTERRIAELAERRAAAQTDLVADGLRPAQRLEILAEALELAGEQSDLEAELEIQRGVLAREQEELETVEADPYAAAVP
jgi:hypothetical protein